MNAHGEVGLTECSWSLLAKYLATSYRIVYMSVGEISVEMQRVIKDKTSYNIEEAPSHNDEISSAITSTKNQAKVGFQSPVHRKGIMHRDINPRNLVVKDFAMTKGTIVDFDNAVEARECGEAWTGNLPYTAPEVLAMKQMPEGNSIHESCSFTVSGGMIGFSLLNDGMILLSTAQSK